MRTPLATPTPHGQQLLAIIGKLEESQWWSPERLRHFQLDVLRRLLTHAHETVPFYRARLADAGYRPGQEITLEFWRQLPLLRRADLQNQGEGLKSTSLPRDHGNAFKISTSGSTGRPVTTWRSEAQELVRQALTLRMSHWHGWDYRLKFGSCRVYGASFPPEGVHQPDWGRPVSLAYQTGPSALLDNRASTAEIAEWLQREKPDYLRMAPALLRDMGAYFTDHDLAAPRLKGILCSSEVIGPDLRDLARRVFGAPLLAAYNAKEIGTMAVQCPKHEHYHVQAEAVFVEVLDDRGNLCAPGETGSVVVTPLQGFAFPLIRYEIGDRAVVGSACACGRPHPVLTQVIGRDRDAVVLPSGERRYCYAVGLKFWEFGDLRQFQIVQKDFYELEVRLVARRQLAPEIEAEIAKRVKTATSTHFSVALTYHESIPRSPSGKFQDLVCEIDPADAPEGRA